MPPAQLAAWNAHLKDFRAKHPEMSLKQAMVAASKTYSGKKKKKAEPSSPKS